MFFPFPHRFLPKYSIALNQLFVWIASLCLIVPLPFHHRHDYSSYTDQWKNLLQNGNPWFTPEGSFTGNAYGPLFNLFAPLYAIHSHLPHLIITLIWLALSCFILNSVADHADEKEKRNLFLFYLLNPFFLTTVVSYGIFDVVVAAVCIVFVVLIRKEKEVKASFALSAAILFKFYPLLLFPFYCLTRTRIRKTLLLTTLFCVFTGLAVTYLIYGNSSLAPFAFAHDRQSSFLSVFRFLRSPYSALGNHDQWSGPMMIAGAAFAGITYLWKRREPLFFGIMAFYLVFLFAKTLNPQFYTVLFFLIPYWIHVEKPVLIRRERWALYTPLLFVSFSKLIYACTQGFKHEWTWIDDVIGLPFFLIQFPCIVILSARMLRATPSSLQGSKVFSGK